jgi:hypothetical protein
MYCAIKKDRTKPTREPSNEETSAAVERSTWLLLTRKYQRAKFTLHDPFPADPALTDQAVLDINATTSGLLREVGRGFTHWPPVRGTA